MFISYIFVSRFLLLISNSQEQLLSFRGTSAQQLRRSTALNLHFSPSLRHVTMSAPESFPVVSIRFILVSRAGH